MSGLRNILNLLQRILNWRQSFAYQRNDIPQKSTYAKMGVDTTNVTGETGFASLKPSLVMKVNVGDASPIGEVSNGSNHYHFVCALIDQSRAQRADRHTRQPTAAPSSLFLEAAWTWTSKSSSGGTGCISMPTRAVLASTFGVLPSPS